MDAQQFLAMFGHIANAPLGVKRLRELVLSLAFRGDLCAQSQDPIQSLLDEIAKQRTESNIETRKQRLVRQGADLACLEGPYSIPNNWRWVSLSAVGRTWGQKKPDAEFTYIDVSSIDNKNGVLASTLQVLSPAAAPSRARKIVKKGTLIYSTVRPYLLNIAIVNRDFDNEPIASTAFAVVHPWAGIEARFLYYYLRSPSFVNYVESVQIGMAYPAISDEKFYSGVVPLSPTEEQSRIVAKVDELMAVCDRLGLQQQARRNLRNDLRQATVQAVAAASSPHELESTWAALESSVQRLFSAPEDVSDFRQLVLDLSIGGLLTDRNMGDEAVTLFVMRCAKGKASRLASGELKRRAAAATDVNQLQTEVPRHWARLPLGELFQFIDYRGKTPTKTDNGVVLVTAKNVRPGRLNREPVEYISEKSYKDWMTRGFPRVGDLLFTTEAPLGNVALVEEPPKFALAQRIISLQPFADLNARCAMYFMMSSVFQLLLERNSTGMTAKGIKASKLKQLELPIPPVNEQTRIVERVERLMQICDKLEIELKAAGKLAERLAVAAISALTGIAVEHAKDEAVKIPQTELIATLHIGQPPDLKDQAPLATLLAHHQGNMRAQDLWQRFGGEIDDFYAQLKTEVAHGWIEQPAVAEVREKSTEAAGA